MYALSLPQSAVCRIKNRHHDIHIGQLTTGLIPSLALQQHRVALQRSKREQEARDQMQQEGKSPKKKAAAAAALLCAKKTNKRKRHNSPFKKGNASSEREHYAVRLYIATGGKNSLETFATG